MDSLEMGLPTTTGTMSAEEQRMGKNQVGEKERWEVEKEGPGMEKEGWGGYRNKVGGGERFASGRRGRKLPCLVSRGRRGTL